MCRLLRTWSVVLFVGLTAVVAAPADDAREKKINVTPPEEIKGTADSKRDARVQAVEDFQTAQSLIRHGRRTRNPLALLTAAQMLADVETKPREEKPVSERHSKEPTGESKPKEVREDTPRSLIEEALTLSKAKSVVALGQTLRSELESTSRGRSAGPYVRTHVVRGGTTDVFTFTFRAREAAAEGIDGDGDTDLDLYVYDEGGHLIGTSTGYGDTEIVRWVPRWTGSFRIRVVNRSPYVANRYLIVTN